MKKALTLLCLIAMMGCKEMDHGNITEKWHEPESWYVMMLPMTISNGKTTSTIMIPYMVHDSEDWCIRIKGVSTKGEEMTDYFYVTEDQFNKYQIGQYVCVKGMCNEDPNNTKEKQ